MDNMKNIKYFAVFCNDRKRVWIKNFTNQHPSISEPCKNINTTLIYYNDNIFHTISELDYPSNDISDIKCDNIDEAKNIFLFFLNKKNKKKIDIIIARYNENVEWIKYFIDIENINIIIYNKGNDNIDELNPKKIENVGREGHTYYYHIYNNYNILSDFTIFLQGNPFDHSPNLIYNIYKILIDDNYNSNFNYLSEYILSCNLNSCKYHANLPIRSVYEKIFNIFDKENFDFNFGAGAQFIIKKENILKHPKEFYLNICNLLNYSINPIEGYVVERLHGLIFY